MTYLHYTFRVRIDHEPDLAQALVAGQQAMDTGDGQAPRYCLGLW